MRKSFVALALLVGATALMTNLALAQEWTRGSDEGLKLRAKKEVGELTRASRLGTYAATDTFWIGHVSSGGQLPWHVGKGNRRILTTTADGVWDFDAIANTDSLQGWFPVNRTTNSSSGTISDLLRPWQLLDYGNRLNATPVQGRTIGVVGVWHCDGGNLQVDAANPGLPAAGGATPGWTPFGGTGKSAWCGLRAGDDFSAMDASARGGTGNPINGDVLYGQTWDGVNITNAGFPGYCNQWDQMLYRDTRVATGGSVTVTFDYATWMDPRLDNGAATGRGWFNYDPLSVSSPNLISATDAGMTQPIDSFMVYVGVPSRPDSCKYSDNSTKPIFDLKRRWFSEVIAINKPYKEILSTFGKDSASAYSVTLNNTEIQPMLDAQHAPDGGGVIRVVFRVKTNANYSDETGTGGSFKSYGYGAARIDNVTITGAGTTNFNTDSDINNGIEAANSTLPGPAVLAGYALDSFHATGKPPKSYFHTHPIFGGFIGVGNYYSVLAYNDLCGPPDSPLRNCNIGGVVVSTGDHDRNEAAGGPLGTAYKEWRGGMMSPTINMVVTGGSTGTALNSCGLDGVHVYTTDDFQLFYDMYAGIMNAPSSGNIWQWGILNYPTVQFNGSRVWGPIALPTYVLFNPDPACFIDYELMKTDGLIETSNPGGIPDSIRIYMGREQRCISWGVTTGCSPTGGHYYDNISMAYPPNLTGAADKISADIWEWFNDAFPANETPGLPTVASAFDTCAAYIKNGINTAITAGSTLRFDIPGDTVYSVTANPDASPIRVDLVFRIYPGPGNYGIVGNKASGLRKVPSNPAIATPGDGSFWSTYIAAPGDFAKPAGPWTSWNVNGWCSARCDTVEADIFPVDGRTANLPGINLDHWMTTYYDGADDAIALNKLNTLGISKPRCFLIDTAATAVLTSSNIDCSGSTPAWLMDPAIAARAGYNNVPTTKEYTKIIPDGLLTPGSHVEYFLRDCRTATTGVFVMVPDTTTIFPQTNEGPNYDGHRWQEFSILPDRWKDNGYGGLGSACMLVVDYNDRRGDERVWVSTADTIGATGVSKYGAHNGWHATGAYIASDGSHDYSNETVSNDNTICVYTHGGSPGTTWDFYQCKASESSTTGCAGIGSRLANRAGGGLLDGIPPFDVTPYPAGGKYSRQGPTPEMLRTFYKVVFLFSGDLNTSILGPLTDRGSNDVGILTDFLTFGTNMTHQRGLWVSGDGFVQAETGAGGIHTTFLSTNLAVSLRDPSYYALSGSAVLFPDLIPTSAITSTGNIYSAQNSCTWTNDVLTVNVAVPSATAASYYQALGSNYPYVSGVLAPASAAHPYVTLVDGWDLYHTRTRFGAGDMGRIVYFMNVLTNVFGSICPGLAPAPTVDVPTNTARTVDFLGNVWGNPMMSGGKATVHFGLAKNDRVEVKVYDVTGRLVRTLADRNFSAGEHSLVWDGSNDQGQLVSRGVYFTQVKFINSRFVDAKKVTVLK